MASEDQFLQNVVVLRHGDRIDDADPLWVSSAPRPWDPHLTEEGKMRAFSTGRTLKAKLEFPFHRVFVSPFIRCIQTASEVVSAICAVHDDGSQLTAENIEIDPSKLEVSIEYGLCEFLNKEAIGHELIPKDGSWVYDISKLEEMLPSGTVNSSVEHVYQELPKWGESKTDAWDRYKRVIQALADKYPYENLLFITHAGALIASISALLKDVAVSGGEFCAYLHSRRLISTSDNQSFTAKEFELLSDSGIYYTHSPVGAS